MTATLLITLDHIEPSELATISDEVASHLEDEFDVISVKPWARPTTRDATASPQGVSPTPTPLP